MYIHLHVRKGALLCTVQITVFIADFDCLGLIGCPDLNGVAGLITHKSLTWPTVTWASKRPA